MLDKNQFKHIYLYSLSLDEYILNLNWYHPVKLLIKFTWCLIALKNPKPKHFI